MSCLCVRQSFYSRRAAFHTLSVLQKRVCVCVCVSVRPSLSLCVDVFKEAILEVKWLQEEHLLALRGPPPVTSSPKFNFPGASASSSSKKVEIISSSHITKQNEVKVCRKRTREKDTEVPLNLPWKEISVVSVWPVFLWSHCVGN